MKIEKEILGSLKVRNWQLKEQNKGLQRSLVRSAVMEPPRQEIPKTQEQKYAEHIGDLAGKTLNYMLKR